MTCVHLKELFHIVKKHDLHMSGAEVIHIVCPQCGLKETCPSAVSDEFEADDDSALSGGDESHEVRKAEARD